MFRFLKNKYFWIVFLVFIISIAVMVSTATTRNNITIVEKFIRNSFTPLQCGMDNLRSNIGGVSLIWADKRILQNQVAELTEENKRLVFDNQALKEYQLEAKRLQRILDFTNDNIDTYDLVAARVIARSPNNWYKNLTINKGADDGVVQGMPVISYEGLVGKVLSVNKNSAQISLVTDREMAVGVIVQENRETNGIVEGIGDNNQLKMINIPYYSNITVGNVIVTSGLSQTYPAGINIGIVDEINREPSGLLLSATIIPTVNFDVLEEVLLIFDYHPIVEVEDD